MKYLYYLGILLIVFSSCSVESFDSREELITADAKPAFKVEETAPTLSYGQVCANESVEFCVDFPQDFKGNGDTKLTIVKFELKIYGDDPETEEIEDSYYEELLNSHENTQACFSYIFTEANAYEVRYKTKGGWVYDEIIAENCGCEENFSYTDNGDGSYTFYYTPAEAMEEAHIVFTFAQSVMVNGPVGWQNNGQTEHLFMDLEECVTYDWKVYLEKNCSGNSQNSNVWTDFKVNDSSKKKEFPNITQSCE